MQTLTVEITDESALKVLRDLEEKHFIKIINSPEKDSAALPGNPMNPKEFREWIAAAEKGETMSLQEAKEAWQKDTVHLFTPGS